MCKDATKQAIRSRGGAYRTQGNCRVDKGMQLRGVHEGPKVALKGNHLHGLQG